MYRTKTDSRIRTKVVQDTQFAQIVKNIATHKGEKRTAKGIYHSSLKNELRECMLKELKEEVLNLTSTKNYSMLRHIDSDSLSNFNFSKLNSEIQTWAPFFFQFISMLVKKSEIGAAVTSSIILKFRNTHMSAFQHVMSQVLDHGGATDEVCGQYANLYTNNVTIIV